VADTGRLNGHPHPDPPRPYVLREPEPGSPYGHLPDDVDLVEVELADDGEILVPEPAETEPVDDPTPELGDWMAERRGRHAAAPRVVPVWLRDADQFRDGAVFLASYYSHQAAFHTIRAPVYLGRLWARAPRGTVRLSRRWASWVTDAEARPVEARASAADPDTWMRFVAVQTRRTGPRRRTSLVVAVPVAVLVTLAAILLPGWALIAGGALALSALGWAGRDADRPIVRRYVTLQLQRRLHSEEVETALEAIGVKGRPDWVSPIAVDGPGWLAELDLPRGVLADTILEKRAELAGAMRRPLACVWPEGDRQTHPGRLRLWVARVDPGNAKRRIWPLMHEGQTDLFGPIPFGWDPRGRLVEVELIGTNWLIGGVMGSGKTSAVLVLSLAAALDPTAELWIYEMKGSGDLEPVQPVCHRYMSGDDDEDCKAALAALVALEKEMVRRKAIVKELPISEVPEGRKVSKRLAQRRDLGLHPLVAIFDEAHTLFEHEEYGEQAAQVAGRLIRKARAYGIIVVFTTQRPDAKSIPRAISDNAILRFCLAVTGHTANNLVLGSGAYARGIRATMFDPQHDAGTGWLARSALNAQIARAAFIKQAEAVETGRRALAIRTSAGTLTGQAAGESAPERDRTDLIDHLRAVWPAGEDAVHSVRLVEALGAYRPDIYSSWITGLAGLDEDEQREARASTSTMLATALKAYGVTTRQINRRGAGGGGKGVRWDDLPPRGRVAEAI
jgi:S-DNA-T family DNA segregation ATPase FtsK/SpoIIIE